jgi:hypothetical protein
MDIMAVMGIRDMRVCVSFRSTLTLKFDFHKQISFSKTSLVSTIKMPFRKLVWFGNSIEFPGNFYNASYVAISIRV